MTETFEAPHKPTFGLLWRLIVAGIRHAFAAHEHVKHSVEVCEAANAAVAEHEDAVAYAEHLRDEVALAAERVTHMAGHVQELSHAARHQRFCAADHVTAMLTGPTGG